MIATKNGQKISGGTNLTESDLQSAFVGFVVSSECPANFDFRFLHFVSTQRFMLRQARMSCKGCQRSSGQPFSGAVVSELSAAPPQVGFRAQTDGRCTMHECRLLRKRCGGGIGNQPSLRNWGLVSQFVALYRRVLVEPIVLCK